MLATSKRILRGPFAAIVGGLILAAVPGCKSPGGGTPAATLAESSSPASPPTWSDLGASEVFEVTQPLFDGTIHELHLHLRGGTFTKMTNHVSAGGDACKDNARYGRVERFVFKNKTSGDTVEIRDVGMKVRGNTSCSNFRKQYKIKFDANADLIEAEDGRVVRRISGVFEGQDGQDVVYSETDSARVDNQTFYGLKSISLRASQNDPTMIREILATEVFAYGEELARQAGSSSAAARGGATYRAGLVRVFVHKGSGAEDFGVFNLVEAIDKTMFKTRWGKNGIKHAFKANLARAKLTEAPSDTAALFTAYEPEVIDGEGFVGDEELKAVADLVSAGQLPSKRLDHARAERRKGEKAIRGLISELQDADSKEKLAALVDIDNILSYMVAANLTGHWDSLVGNANNDFLVLNAKTNKWQIVAWDMDNVLGSLATGNSDFNTVWNAGHREFKKGSRDLLTASERPLFYKTMKYFKAEYDEKMAAFLKGGYDLHRVNNRIEKLRNLFTGGHSDDPIWQTLFSFKNHRFAYGVCGLKGKRAVIDGLFPRFDDYEAKKPACR